MIVNETTPPNEDKILIWHGAKNVVSGNYYFDDDGDFYTHDGELIEDVIGWSEMPEIQVE